MIVEIVVCLALAALLGLLVGWLIQRTFSSRQAAKASAEANAKYEALELSSHQEVKNLEDQIQDLGSELKSAKLTNLSLNHSLQDSKSTIDKAHSESVEITEAQLETKERLQAIIREKDLEISRLLDTQPSGNTNLAAAAATVGASASLVKQISQPHDMSTNRDTDEYRQDTLDENDLADESLDATTLLQKPAESIQSDKITDQHTAATVAALNASTDQLKGERQALLDALSEGEETIAIDHRDLPINLRQNISPSDIDKTIALDELDKTIKADPRDLDDTEMSDTLETP